MMPAAPTGPPRASSRAGARLARIAALCRGGPPHLRVAPGGAPAAARAAAAAVRPTVKGTVAPGWEAVAVAFADNFVSRDELGAAVGVCHKGELVVNIWGGTRDPTDGSEWDSDTIVNVFSSTKGVVALGASMLIDRGLLDIAAPVAKYWPEFAAAGKGELTVGMLLSHQAGCALRPCRPICLACSTADGRHCPCHRQVDGC